MKNKHTISDLYQMQALPLSAKIRMTENRIMAWVEEYGVDGVYVSFSGGKDREEMNDEHVEKIIMVIEHRKQIVNAMRKIIKMLEVVRNEQIN